MGFGNENNPKMVFGPNGQPHVFVGNKNIFTDINTGTFYSQNGNLIVGSDGSLNSMVGDNFVIGTDGSHSILGPDNGPKIVL
jgi:hypothetical protein